MRDTDFDLWETLGPSMERISDSFYISVRFAVYKMDAGECNQDWCILKEDTRAKLLFLRLWAETVLYHYSITSPLCTQCKNSEIHCFRNNALTPC